MERIRERIARLRRRSGEFIASGEATRQSRG